jgi:hypothetical protein
LKANKVNLFVSSVLCVFWYHSPNVLYTLHICNISWLRVKPLYNAAVYSVLRFCVPYGRCTCEIKSRIAVTKAAFNKKRAIFTSKMDLELRKKLVKCYIWSIALYGV